MIQRRLEELRLRPAQGLAGVVQFEVLGSSDAFHLVLAGAKSRAQDGRAPNATTRVTVDGHALSRMLAGRTAGAPVFRVAGDVGTYQALFRALAEAEEPQSWLDLSKK